MASWWKRDKQARKGAWAAAQQAKAERRLGEIQAALREAAWPDPVTAESHVDAAWALRGADGRLSPRDFRWLDNHKEYSDILFGGPSAGLPPQGRNAANHRQHQREVTRNPDSAPWPEGLFVPLAQDGLVYGLVRSDLEVQRVVVDVTVAGGLDELTLTEGAYNDLRAKQNELGSSGSALMVVLDQLPTDDEKIPNALLDALMMLAVHAKNPHLTLRLPPELREYAERCAAARRQWSRNNSNLREVTLLSTGGPSDPPRRTAARIAEPGTFGAAWQLPGRNPPASGMN